MKIGLIADIHADLDGLEMALKFLRDKQVDTILCAGDLVDKGAHGDAVVARIRRENIPTVYGNHDVIARETRDYLRNHPAAQPELILIDDSITFLEGLPKILTFTFDGCTLLLAHGAPWDENDYLYPISDAARFRQVFEVARTNYVILGHTHCPLVVYVSGKGTIINPGAVYGNMLSSRFPEIERHSCAILSLPDGEITHCDFHSGNVMTVPQRTIEADDT
jgi:putative phosphoesterase